MLDYQIKKLEAKVLGIPLEQVIINGVDLNQGQKDQLDQMILKLKNGYPLDYLIGEVEVIGLNLVLDENVLIPRPETEEWLQVLVDENQKEFEFMSFDSSDLVVDLGTGSGLIGLFLAKYFKQVLAVDISKEALKIAFANAQKNLIKNVQFFESNGLLDPILRKTILAQAVINPWVLVANLPYVPNTDLGQASEYKVNHEPELAIYSGSDGLDLYREIVNQIKTFIIQPEQVFFELDPRNICEAKEVLEVLGYNVNIWSDSGGYERLLVGSKKTKFDF